MFILKVLTGVAFCIANPKKREIVADALEQDYTRTARAKISVCGPLAA